MPNPFDNPESKQSQTRPAAAAAAAYIYASVLPKNEQTAQFLPPENVKTYAENLDYYAKNKDKAAIMLDFFIENRIQLENSVEHKSKWYEFKRIPESKRIAAKEINNRWQEVAIEEISKRLTLDNLVQPSRIFNSDSMEIALEPRENYKIAKKFPELLRQANGNFDQAIAVTNSLMAQNYYDRFIKSNVISNAIEKAKNNLTEKIKNEPIPEKTSAQNEFLETISNDFSEANKQRKQTVMDELVSSDKAKKIRANEQWNTLLNRMIPSGEFFPHLKKEEKILQHAQKQMLTHLLSASLTQPFGEAMNQIPSNLAEEDARAEENARNASNQAFYRGYEHICESEIDSSLYKISNESCEKQEDVLAKSLIESINHPEIAIDNLSDEKKELEEVGRENLFDRYQVTADDIMNLAPKSIFTKIAENVRGSINKTYEYFSEIPSRIGYTLNQAYQGASNFISNIFSTKTSAAPVTPSHAANSAPPTPPASEVVQSPIHHNEAANASEHRESRTSSNDLVAKLQSNLKNLDHSSEDQAILHREIPIRDSAEHKHVSASASESKHVASSPPSPTTVVNDFEAPHPG